MREYQKVCSEELSIYLSIYLRIYLQMKKRKKPKQYSKCWMALVSFRHNFCFVSVAMLCYNHALLLTKPRRDENEEK